MKGRSLCCLVVLLSLFASSAKADVKLPAVFGSHMVLQQDKPIVVWGTAAADEEVTVQIGQRKATTKADAQGKWQVKLPAMKADNEAHTLTVSGNNQIELEDVLLGEVWIGSGQSNMEFALSNTQDAQQAVAAADHPQIRLFHVPKVQTNQPATDVQAQWNVCTPQTVGGFSAVLYFFGRRIQEEQKVPVGLINSSWGGSPIEPWTVTDTQSGNMYNGMIAPLIPLSIRGAIWYQGESNVNNGFAYADKMKALIEGWRGKWGEEFPFYFVQIAPFGGYGPGLLPALWEGQVATLKLPNTGMAVVTDAVHNINDIHPINKLDVGNRLALWALAKDYGHSAMVYSGPLYKSMKVDGNTIRISFAHVGGGLKVRGDGSLNEFQIAGSDGKFVPAEATIDGDMVVVKSEKVTEPTQIRFGWHKAANPNLINAEGLPASPFQTDNWRGSTGQ